MSYQYHIQTIIPVSKSSLLVVAVITIVFIGIGITREVYAAKQSTADNEVMVERIQFWVGNNGMLLSILLYTLVLLAIALIMKILKNLPTWTAVLREYGSLSLGYVNDTTTKIARLSDTADSLMKNLPTIIKDALVQSALVVSNGKSIVDQMVQKK